MEHDVQPRARLAHRSVGAARAVLGHAVRRREFAIFLALALIVTAISVVAPNFLAVTNLNILSRQIALGAIVALGELFVILHGGIDLSVGSILALAGMVAGYFLQLEFHPALAVMAGVAAGLVMGGVNGALVSYVRLAPFIVTLGMMSLASGLVLGFSKGQPITDIPESFLPIANGSLLGLSIPVWITLVLAVLIHIVLTYTAFGRRVYAIGGNEQATLLSGVPVRRIKFGLYMISAGCASITGIILVARYNSAQAEPVKGAELSAIAAAVIGGTSLSGGSGSVLGVLIGACIMGIVDNGLIQMHISAYWHAAIIGVIIVLAAVLDRAKRRGAA